MCKDDNQIIIGLPHCVINAITDALMASHMGYPAFVAEYDALQDGKVIGHAQGVVELPGERFRYLTHDTADGVVKTSDRHFEAVPPRAETWKPVRQFINEQLPHLKVI